jgi:hypothetical protein
MLAKLSANMKIKCVKLTFILLCISQKKTPIIPPGEIQASFFLLKKRQQLIPHVRRLQKDIYREIGIPNTTVCHYSTLTKEFVLHSSYTEMIAENFAGFGFYAYIQI